MNFEADMPIIDVFLYFQDGTGKTLDISTTYIAVSKLLDSPFLYPTVGKSRIKLGMTGLSHQHYTPIHTGERIHRDKNFTLTRKSDHYCYFDKDSRDGSGIWLIWEDTLNKDDPIESGHKISLLNSLNHEYLVPGKASWDPEVTLLTTSRDKFYWTVERVL